MSLSNTLGTFQFSFFIFSVLIAFGVAKLCIDLFNILPADWLCDYDELPNENLFKKRLSLNPHGIILAFCLTAAFICLYFQYNGYNFYFFSFCLLAVILMLISFSDFTYFIIPNQFTFALFILAVIIVFYDLLSGNHRFYSNFLFPIYGAVSGSCIMLVLAFLGKLQFKKEAMGFGDVKLFGVIGLIASFPNIFIVFLLTVFSAFFYILYLLCRKRLIKGLYLPLGPYICFSLLLYLSFNRQINYFVGWYLSLFNI